MFEFSDVLESESWAGVDDFSLKHLDEIGIWTIAIWVYRFKEGFLFFCSFAVGFLAPLSQGLEYYLPLISILFN